eukprot:scaffold82962_cov88-Phaeocystis_antarctica.AAC.2
MFCIDWAVCAESGPAVEWNPMWKVAAEPACRPAAAGRDCSGDTTRADTLEYSTRPTPVLWAALGMKCNTAQSVYAAVRTVPHRRFVVQFSPPPRGLELPTALPTEPQPPKSRSARAARSRLELTAYRTAYLSSS